MCVYIYIYIMCIYIHISPGKSHIEVLTCFLPLNGMSFPQLFWRVWFTNRSKPVEEATHIFSVLIPVNGTYLPQLF